MTREFAAAVIEELQARVAAAASRWGLAPGTPTRLLGVSENATFLLGEPGGRELVVRVHRTGYSSAAEIRAELAWIEALRADGAIATAAPVPGVDGEAIQVLAGDPVTGNATGNATATAAGAAVPRFAVAFERLRGRAPAVTEAPRWFERLGETTAQLHRHARSWLPPAAFVRKRWDLDAMVGPNAVWGSWRAARGLDAAGTQILGRALAAIRRRLARSGSSAQNVGLIHADLRLANLLVDGTALQIIDFDDCGFGRLAYDFAASVSFIEQETLLPELLAAWCRGYRRVRPLAAAVQAEIAPCVLLRRILLTAWVASHAEVPLARECGADFAHGTVELAEQLLSGRFLAGSANN